jgi:hypothetical protein
MSVDDLNTLFTTKVLHILVLHLFRIHGRTIVNPYVALLIFLHYYSSLDFENTRISLDVGPQRASRFTTLDPVESKINSILQVYLVRHHGSQLSMRTTLIPNLKNSVVNVIDPLAPWVNLASNFKETDVVSIRALFSSELLKLLNLFEEFHSHEDQSPVDTVDHFLSECFCNIKILSDQQRASGSILEYSSLEEMKKLPYTLPMFSEGLSPKTLVQQYEFFRSYMVWYINNLPL